MAMEMDVAVRQHTSPDGSARRIVRALVTLAVVVGLGALVVWGGSSPDEARQRWRLNESGRSKRLCAYRSTAMVSPS